MHPFLSGRRIVIPIPAHIPRCQYVRTNGVRCGSPSLKNRVFCYYHFKASCPPPVSCEITPVETADGIQIAIGNVLQALDNDRIDIKKAVAMLYGLQTASSNLKRTNPQPAWDEVETELGPLDQEAWHKNIAVETAKRLHEEDFASRHGTAPGAGLNKSGRSAGAPSFAQRRVGLNERAERDPNDVFTECADAHTSAHPRLASLTGDGAPDPEERRVS